MENQNLIPSEGYVTFVNARLPYTCVDGVFYVAIKPLAEAIGLNTDKALESVKSDENLAELHTVRRVVAADGKRREMLCLPWKFVFGWLFTISLKHVKEEAKPVLKDYQMKCYDILHDFFVGSAEHMTRRKALYLELAQMKVQMLELETRLGDNEDYQTLLGLKKTYNAKRKEFQALDDEEFGSQLSLLE